MNAAHFWERTIKNKKRARVFFFILTLLLFLFLLGRRIVVAELGRKAGAAERAVVVVGIGNGRYWN